MPLSTLRAGQEWLSHAALSGSRARGSASHRPSFSSSFLGSGYPPRMVLLGLDTSIEAHSPGHTKACRLAHTLLSGLKRLAVTLNGRLRQKKRVAVQIRTMHASSLMLEQEGILRKGLDSSAHLKDSKYKQRREERCRQSQASGDLPTATKMMKTSHCRIFATRMAPMAPAAL